MIVFWSLVALMLLVSVGFVLMPMFLAARKNSADSVASPDDVTQDAVNLRLFHQQLAELDMDLYNGRLDEDQHQAARRDLERELLHDVGGSGSQPEAAGRSDQTRGRGLIPVLAAVVPLVALGFYLATATPDIIPRLAAAPQSPAHGANGEMPPLDQLAEQLAARMQQNPADLEGWMMLGRTYFALGQTRQALGAIEQAHALAPDNLDVKLTYAEALAANNDNRLEGRPAELIEEILAVEPDYINALWLNGMRYFRRGDYATAVQSWQQVLRQIDPDSSDASDLRGLIAEARKRGQLPDVAMDQDRMLATGNQMAPSEKTDVDKGAAPGVAVAVDVAVAASVVADVNPDSVVFVYAKAAEGPPMPLAVARLRAGDLPTQARLDDSMAMSPAMQLSNFPAIIVGARISLSGQAMPMSGDFQGETGPVDTNSLKGPVQVLIDERVP